MAKFKEGQHVALKGMTLTGLSGTIAHKGLRFYRVRLDEGQSRGGNTMVTVAKGNMAAI
jgi:hypothetical protein